MESITGAQQIGDTDMSRQNDSYSLYCRSPKGCYVYFITPDDEQDIVKIGISKDPFVRRRSLQVSSYKLLKLKLFFGPWSVKDAKNIEKEIHKELTKNKIRGEWYNISFGVAWKFFHIKEMAYGENLGLTV